MLFNRLAVAILGYHLQGGFGFFLRPPTTNHGGNNILNTEITYPI